jgi:hypothetical protein
MVPQVFRKYLGLIQILELYLWFQQATMVIDCLSVAWSEMRQEAVGRGRGR